MITGEIKNQADRIWDAFWSGGISNPIEVIEQITYLLFLRRLDMDLSSWLEFFVGGLATQLEEVKARGTAAIRRDILVREHRLNERQGRAIEYLLGFPKMDIGEFERLCPDVSRRTLQRDLAALEAKALICHEGETNQLVYKLADKL